MKRATTATRKPARADGHVIGLRLYVERDNHIAQDTYRRMGMDAAGYLVFERYPL